MMKDLIERYIYAVVRRLPENIQEEVKNELRSNIYDMLPDHASDQDIERLLIELGNPRDMAIKYQPKERYLISPRYFFDYMYVLKIVTVIFVLVSVAFGIMDTIINNTSTGFFEITGQIIGSVMSNIFESIFTSFAIVTIIFVIIEHTQVGQKAKEWKLKDLPALPKENKVKISRTSTVISIIFSMTFGIIFIMVLAQYHTYIGIYDGSIIVARFFNPEWIRPFVLFFTMLLVGGLSVGILKLKDGQWTKRVAISYTLYELASLVLFIVFLTSSRLILPEFFEEMGNIFERETYQIERGFYFGFRLLVVLITLLIAIDLSATWYKIFKHQKKV